MSRLWLVWFYIVVAAAALFIKLNHKEGVWTEHSLTRDGFFVIILNVWGQESCQLAC